METTVKKETSFLVSELLDRLGIKGKFEEIEFMSVKSKKQDAIIRIINRGPQLNVGGGFH